MKTTPKKREECELCKKGICSVHQPTHNTEEERDEIKAILYEFHLNMKYEKDEFRDETIEKTVNTLLSHFKQRMEAIEGELPDAGNDTHTEQQIIDDENYPMIERGIVMERSRIRQIIIKYKQ